MLIMRPNLNSTLRFNCRKKSRRKSNTSTRKKSHTHKCNIPVNNMKLFRNQSEIVREEFT